MENKHALVAGSTGLIGTNLCELLANDSNYLSVSALVREKNNFSNTRITEITTNFDESEKIELTHPVTDAFCCLGTTMKNAGSKEAFYKVDYTYVLSFAQLVLNKGSKNFYIVTAMGADSKSMFYYNRVKGEVESALKKLDFENLHIFRPSLLLGNRKEHRIGESIGKLVSSIFNPIIPSDYKGIEGKQVAKGMVLQAMKNQKGQFIHSSGEIAKMG